MQAVDDDDIGADDNQVDLLLCLQSSFKKENINIIVSLSFSNKETSEETAFQNKSK